jgi:hypothetical protein
MALSKSMAIREAMALSIRVEAFNVFNHTQFFGPSSVNAVLGSSGFGQVVAASAPRILQLATKFTF